MVSWFNSFCYVLISPIPFFDNLWTTWECTEVVVHCVLDAEDNESCCRHRQSVGLCYFTWMRLVFVTARCVSVAWIWNPGITLMSEANVNDRFFCFWIGTFLHRKYDFCYCYVKNVSYTKNLTLAGMFSSTLVYRYFNHLYIL